MPDTSFTIELQGLTLPDTVKNTLQSELKSVVLSELAKTDLGNQLTVEPLPASSDRSLMAINPVLGFVLRNPLTTILNAAVRDTTQVPAIPVPTFAATSAAPFDGASLVDVLSALYYRPDVHAAIVSNSRAFAQLLSRDDQATQALNQLIGGDTGGGTDKIAPLILAGILAICAAAGVGVGIWSRK